MARLTTVLAFTALDHDKVAVGCVLVTKEGIFVAPHALAGARECRTGNLRRRNHDPPVCRRARGDKNRRGESRADINTPRFAAAGDTVYDLAQLPSDHLFWSFD